MSVEWREDKDLSAICRKLVDDHHGHLIGYPLRIVFRSKSRRLRGSLTYGTAEIVSGRFAFFVMTEDEKGMDGQDKGSKMFWIEIAEDLWEELSPNQRLALVDHELMHCVIEEDEEGTPYMDIRPHDIEEFADIVRRHGLWDEGLWNFGLAIMESVDVQGVGGA